MSRILHVRNVNHAFMEGMWHLKLEGVREESRNGPVLVAPGLVVTEYTHPRERVIFNPRRDANPVFHLMEAIWMLAGRDDSAWLEQFNARYKDYADLGIVHGAYGHRWRRGFSPFTFFGLDQLPQIVACLKRDPASRQAVLQMWDYGHGDLTGTWRDRPCNTHVYFDLRPDASGVRRLNMTVCCRSNDMLWGAYGANVVHFSILQEVLAAELGVDVGAYRQMSNNFHVYADNPMVKAFLEMPPFDAYDLYDMCKIIPFVAPGETLDDILNDCERFCDGEVTSTEFLSTVAAPLRDAYLRRKAGLAWDILNVPACDWKLAFSEWVARRV